MSEGHRPSSKALGCQIVAWGSAALIFKAKQEQYTAVTNHALPSPSPRTYKAWVPSASKHSCAVQHKPSEPGNSLEHVTKMWRSSVWNSLCIIQLDESMPCLVSEGPWWPELLGGRNTAEGSPGYWYTGLKGHILGPAVGNSVILLLWQIALIRQKSYPRIPEIQEQVRSSEKEELQLRYREQSQQSHLRKSFRCNSKIEFRQLCPMAQHSALHPKAQSPRLATLCHWVGCLTFCVICIFLIVIFTVAGESEGLPLSTFINLLQKSTGTNFHLGQELMSHSAIG